MIIDAHTHLLARGHWPSEWWRWVAEDWARRGADRRPEDIESKIEAGLIDPDGSRMVERMDGAGVDASVVLPIDWGPGFSGTRPITDVVDQTLWLSIRHSGRLIPFGGIDPRRPEAVDLVQEWFARGVRGLKLYPSCGWDPASKGARAVYTECDRLRRPVLFHTGDPLPLLDRANSNPNLLAEVAGDFPNMPVWLGHAGAPRWWKEALTLAARFDNVRLELSVWIWDDTTEDGKRIFDDHFAEALATVGPAKIIFGTDHVSGRRVRTPEFLGKILAFYQGLPERMAARGVDFGPTDLAAVLGLNAKTDLGLL